MQNNKPIATPTKIECELNLISKLIMECFSFKTLNKSDITVVHNAEMPMEDMEYLMAHDYLFSDCFNCCSIDMLEMYLNLFVCICKNGIINRQKILRMLSDINMNEADYKRVPFKLMRRLLKINDGLCEARYLYVFKEHTTVNGSLNKWLSAIIALPSSYKKVSSYIKLMLKSPP